jgi:DNA-binding MarR family transcriptional regulator
MARPLDKSLESLIDEVRLLWNTLVQRGERLHEAEPITMGMRAVLEFLARNGPTSVPNIARSRRVTRQHIQVQVNALQDEGCVELLPNPAHRRSLLVASTPRGTRTLARMRDREAAVFADAPVTPSPAQLERAAGTLRAVREALED